jgi:hypothetical protein
MTGIAAVLFSLLGGILFWWRGAVGESESMLPLGIIFGILGSVSALICMLFYIFWSKYGTKPLYGVIFIICAITIQIIVPFAVWAIQAS